MQITSTQKLSIRVWGPFLEFIVPIQTLKNTLTKLTYLSLEAKMAGQSVHSYNFSSKSIQDRCKRLQKERKF